MWNVHENKEELKISDANTIYHPEHGVLCYVETGGDVYLYHPINFKTKALAAKWIENGCIAEIQEGLGTLKVGFSTVVIKTIK